MQASVTNFFRSVRIELTEEHFRNLSGGGSPEQILEESQWTAIRAKMPRTPTADLIIRKVDEKTNATTNQPIWYEGIGESPKYRKSYFTK